MNVDPDEIAKRIDIDLKNWPGNCAWIAQAVLDAEIVEGKHQYGFFYGDVTPGPIFKTQGPHRHGWIRLEDGRVYDPTRWVFEQAKPYIYVGDGDDYDHGMRSVRTSKGGEALALEFLDAYHGGQRDFDFDDLMKIGNTFPEHLGGIAGEVYETLDALGHQAVVPYDFWKEVMD